MVQVTVFTQGERHLGFQLKGHAGCGAYGEDIVCAGISAIVQTAILGITEVLQLKAEVLLQEGNTLCLIRGEALWEALDKADTVIRTMEAGLTSIQMAYPKVLKFSYREV